MMSPNLLPSLLPVPQGALNPWVWHVSHHSSHPEAGCDWLHPAPTALTLEAQDFLLGGNAEEHNARDNYGACQPEGP